MEGVQELQQLTQLRQLRQVRQVRARVVLDLLAVEQMPSWAAHALEAGLDCASLREVAGMDGHDPRQVRAVFHAALDELGAPALDEEQARWEMARVWARAIVEGTVRPYEGARRIWWEAASPLELPDALVDFVALASEWEDAPAHRAAYEQDIVQAARQLLTSDG